MKNFWLSFVLIFLIPVFTFAFSPEEKLADEIKEERAIEIFHKVRCVVCSGQAIDSSDSQFAYNLRSFIRQKVSEDFSDEQIEDELVKKFGQDILLKPSNSTSITIILVAFLISSLFLIFLFRAKIVSFKS